MPHFDAVLFDLDGTLLYTLPDIHAAVCRALTLNGYGVHAMEDTRRFVGTGSRELVRKSLPADASPEEVDRVLVTYRAEYKAALVVDIVPYARIPETLAALRDKGLALGVVTNKPMRTRCTSSTGASRACSASPKATGTGSPSSPRRTRYTPRWTLWASRRSALFTSATRKWTP